MEVNTISNLPDDVLVHILSLLPLKQAASTTLLSHRFFDLWKYIAKLDFKALPLTPQETLHFVNRVNSFLKSHKGDLQEFTVDFYAIKSDCHQMAEWLEFAFSKRVERLDLNWHCHHLFDDTLALEDILVNITLPSSGIRSLKVLRLSQTIITANDVHFFLRKCPLLEQLVIKDVIMESDLEVVGLSLKHLYIRPHENNFSVKVYAPSLTSLRIDLDKGKLFLVNVPKLVHMVFCCRFDSTLHDFAKSASRLETLSISMDRPKASFSVPEMPKLKKLAVDDHYHIQYKCIIPFPITCFLRASPRLQEFEVKITKLTLEEGVTDEFRHSSLKRFKVLWSCGRSPCDGRIKLVRYVVDSCVALEEIYISQCDGKESGKYYGVVVDDCVRVATAEERLAFENTTQLQLPEHIKLRIVNHSHKTHLELVALAARP